MSIKRKDENGLVRRANMEELSEKRRKDSMLTPLYYTDDRVNKTGKKYSMVMCRCSCGNTKAVDSSSLSSIVSCGCFSKKSSLERFQKYFPVNRKIYNTYCKMMERCYNKKLKSYKYYGGRGVIVCEEWRGKYQNFLDWALANGWKEGLFLDKDIKGNGMIYSPQTCCFVTRKENNEYTRRAVWFDYNGRKMKLNDICELNNLPYKLVYPRVKYLGMSLEDALYFGRYTKKIPIKMSAKKLSA